MLKPLSSKSAKPKKTKVEIGSDCKAGRNIGGEINRKKTDNDEVDDEVDNEVDNEIGKKGQKTSKSKNLFKKLSKSKKTVKSDFLTLRAKLAFIQLRQAFFKALIFYHFNSKRHIQIETDVSSYAIGEVLSQLILDNSGQWHLVAFFLSKDDFT